MAVSFSRHRHEAWREPLAFGRPFPQGELLHFELMSTACNRHIVAVWGLEQPRSSGRDCIRRALMEVEEISALARRREWHFADCAGSESGSDRFLPPCPSLAREFRRGLEVVLSCEALRTTLPHVGGGSTLTWADA